MPYDSCKCSPKRAPPPSEERIEGAFLIYHGFSRTLSSEGPVYIYNRGWWRLQPFSLSRAHSAKFLFDDGTEHNRGNDLHRFSCVYLLVNGFDLNTERWRR